MPGDTLELQITLKEPLALEVGTRYVSACFETAIDRLIVVQVYTSWRGSHK